MSSAKPSAPVTATATATSAPAAIVAPPRLLLHFDINKTIIICDPVSGTSLQQMCEVLLTEYCWGRVDNMPDTSTAATATTTAAPPLVWTCISTEPTLTPPLQPHNGTPTQSSRRIAGSRGSSRRNSGADLTTADQKAATASPALKQASTSGASSPPPLALGGSVAAASVSPQSVQHKSITAILADHKLQSGGVGGGGGGSPGHSPQLSPVMVTASSGNSSPPTVPGGSVGGPKSVIMTYAAFLEIKFPNRPGMDEATRIANAKLKDTRREYKRRFTQSGEAGERFAPVRIKLIEALSLPKTIPAGLKLPKMLSDGRVFLLPCFFELLLHLHATNRDYAIVFRTFGNDLPDVSEELNHFADGAHPVHATPQNGPLPHLKSDATSCGGAFYRSENETALVWGTTDTVPTSYKDGITFFFDKSTSATRAGLNIVRTFAGIYNSIYDRVWTAAPAPASAAISGTDSKSAPTQTAASAPAGRVYLLHDYYPWWAANHESSDSGKLLVVDTKNPVCPSRALALVGGTCSPFNPLIACQNVLSIFFDDNVELADPHIVDARDLHTGQSLDLSVTADRFTFRAEPLLSIGDSQYFVKALETCERNFKRYGFAPATRTAPLTATTNGSIIRFHHSPSPQLSPHPSPSLKAAPAPVVTLTVPLSGAEK